MSKLNTKKKLATMPPTDGTKRPATPYPKKMSPELENAIDRRNDTDVELAEVVHTANGLSKEIGHQSNRIQSANESQNMIRHTAAAIKTKYDTTNENLNNLNVKLGAVEKQLSQAQDAVSDLKMTINKVVSARQSHENKLDKSMSKGLELNDQAKQFHEEKNMIAKNIANQSQKIHELSKYKSSMIQ